MLNQVTVIGNLGRDPELRHSQSGVAMGTMNVAATSKWKTRDGEKHEHTEWFRVTMFGATAENCAKYLAKGSKVYVQGELRTREYEKDGENKRITELMAQRVVFLTTANGGGSQPEQGTLLPDDDVPF